MKIPEFFKDMLLNQYENNTLDKIVEGLLSERKVTFRVNTHKASILEIKNILCENGIKFSEVNWYKEAFILEDIREDEIRKLDIYKDGKIYLQSLSSMLPPIILSPKENENILDMTAAPRGKNNTNV